MKQSTAISILKAGKNVFLTGSAGAGKTYTLNKYITYLKKRKIPVAVTASTGIAATHLNGITIHAWAGIGIKNALSKKDLEQIINKKKQRESIEKTKVLIIDEISMLHRNQLEIVNQVLKFIRKSELPFGGVQVIFCGDFFQLPPIGESHETNREKFAFMSNAWLEAAPFICYLKEQHRQKDNALDKVLNQIRTGEIDSETVNLLQAASKNIVQNAPKLFTHNYDVEQINKKEMALLGNKSKIFSAETKGKARYLDMLKSNVRTDTDLELKIGAKVMFVKNNFEKGYINGSLGTVIDFTNEGSPVVELKDGNRIFCEREKWAIEDETGKELASFEQYPLRAAWAITVHKSQGMTLDTAEVDLRNTFEKGQGYVALSRVKSLEGLKLLGFNFMALELDTLASKADKRFKELSNEAEKRFNVEELEAMALEFIIQSGGLLNVNDNEPFVAENVISDRKTTVQKTLELIEIGMSLEEIAETRGIAISTVIQHLEKISKLYPDAEINRFRPKGSLKGKVEKIWHKILLNPTEESLGTDGKPRIRALYEGMKGTVSWNEIRLALIFLNEL